MFKEAAGVNTEDNGGLTPSNVVDVVQQKPREIQPITPANLGRLNALIRLRVH